MNALDTSVRAEYTPNPNSLKFIVSEAIYTGGSLTFDSAETAESNPMAKKLFTVNGVTKVFIMSNFVTIDKVDQINWKDIHLEIKNIIKEELDAFKEWAKENAPQKKEIKYDGDDAYEIKRQKIEEVLDKIRPALMADGGNIEFVDIIEMDVRLRMVGACGSCPSAMMTMKMGVERALTSELPDIVETVTQVY